MKFREMCSCFRKKSKQGQDEVGELETLSQEKIPTADVAAGDHDAPPAGSHGVSTSASNDGGSAALAMGGSAKEGGSSHGHGGDG